jgi:hypothetical protein
VSPTQLPKKGGSASRRDASSSSANLIARLRGRVFLFVFLVGEGKKPVSQWRGASLSQKLRRLSKWFPGLSGMLSGSVPVSHGTPHGKRFGPEALLPT